MNEDFQDLVSTWERSHRRFAEQPLFGEKRDGTWVWHSFAEVARKVDGFRATLTGLGVAAGDRVALVSNNRLEWAVVVHATLGLGAVYVPMYEAQAHEDWAFILRDSGAKVVFGATRPIFDKLSELKSEIPTLHHVCGFDLPPEHEQGFSRLLASGAAQPSIKSRSVDPKDPAGFIYTSGTTGQPKGVMLSHENFCANLNGLRELFPIGSTDRSLAFLPWGHVFGQTAEFFLLPALGCSVALNDDVTKLVSNLPDVRPTVLVAVPRIFNRIYDGVNQQMQDKPAPIRALFRAGIRAATKRSRGAKLGFSEALALKTADALIFKKVRQKFGGRLKLAVSGSAALSREVAEFIDALGIEVYEGYGLTETSPVVTCNSPGHRKLGSVGKALPGVRLEIDRVVTGDEKSGEIIVHGDLVMLGYHGHPDETRATMTADRGLRTGDMGYVDEDGYLFITGRIKEQYKLENGKYVVPSPLEEELKLSPYISNVMLHGANRPHNVALVVLDLANLKKWAEREHVTLGEPLQNPRVTELIKSELARHSESFRSYERPRAFTLISEEFSVENGLLTPKMSVRRNRVLSRYGAVLEGLYTK